MQVRNNGLFDKPSIKNNNAYKFEFSKEGWIPLSNGIEQEASYKNISYFHKYENRTMLSS